MLHCGLSITKTTLSTRYDDIFILQTFDKTGTQRAFVEKDDGDPTPGPGWQCMDEQMFIAF